MVNNNENLGSEMLQTSKSFDKLIENANEIQSKCVDHKVAVKDLSINEDLQLDLGNGNAINMSNLATSHLCGKLGVPSRYYTKMVETGHSDLARENLNAWFPDDKRTFFVRQYEDHARGILSGSYSQFDTPEILKEVAEVFDPKTFDLKGSFLSEERLHLRLVQKEMLPIDGEDLFAGISLDSSDVGRCGLYVRFFVWKQVCTNGLIIAKSSAKLFTQKHIGITSEDFREGLRAGLENIEEVKRVVTDQIIATGKIPMKTDMEELIKDIKTATLLSDDMAQKVIDIATAKYASTNWGIINGITEVAQDFSLERRLQLEEAAATMLV